jgi:hypothetical protein
MGTWCAHAGGAYWDHVHLWLRDGRPAALTFQPYTWGPAHEAELVKDLEPFGLTFQVSKTESWWWPGKTWLVVVERDPDMATWFIRGQIYMSGKNAMERAQRLADDLNTSPRSRLVASSSVLRTLRQKRSKRSNGLRSLNSMVYGQPFGLTNGMSAGEKRSEP